MKSMTGYGFGASEADGRHCSVELKSTNHRFLDISFRMPRVMAFLEETVRKAVGSRISRGHIDVFIVYRNDRADARSVIVDRALALAYGQALKVTAELLDSEEKISPRWVAQLPEVLRIDTVEEDREALGQLCADALNIALDGLTAMRTTEGKSLHEELAARLATLESLRSEIAASAPTIAHDYREKLTLRMSEAIGAYPDPQRLALEVALLADRASVDEELARLCSHFSQMRALFDSSQPVGRKMDFLIQEFFREINTIGSKSLSADITGLVVDAKAEVEKLREQIQNIE